MLKTSERSTTSIFEAVAHILSRKSRTPYGVDDIMVGFEHLHPMRTGNPATSRVGMKAFAARYSCDKLSAKWQRSSLRSSCRGSVIILMRMAKAARRNHVHSVHALQLSFNMVQHCLGVLCDDDALKEYFCTAAEGFRKLNLC